VKWASARTNKTIVDNNRVKKKKGNERRGMRREEKKKKRSRTARTEKKKDMCLMPTLISGSSLKPTQLEDKRMNSRTSARYPACLGLKAK
jgi:hypothetical protein